MNLMLATALLLAPQESELGKKLLETWQSAADWMASQQQPSGAWMSGPKEQQMASPAFTALIVTSLANAPGKVRAKYKGAVDRAMGYLLSKTGADGSFGEGPTGGYMKTYTTAVTLMALSSVERSDRILDALRGAQGYLKHSQLQEGIHRGGLGYGDEEPKVRDGRVEIQRTIASISASGFGAEGMIMAERAGLPRDEQFWKLVVEFVRKCQNSTEVNKDAEWLAELKKARLSVGEDGGLFYSPVADPGVQKAGTVKLADREAIASYGSMTYEGIKTYIYAGLAKDSPEVKAAVDWVRKNWTLEKHPGFAYDQVRRHHLRGLYYYYLAMARALDAYGENPFETFDGVRHDWPREMAESLLRQVRDSRMWKNDNPAWYEGDPVLTTSYVLTTCDVLFKYLR